MKILEELWYGNVTPGERGVEKDGRLWNLGRLILQNEEELAPLLSEKAKEVLEKLRDVWLLQRVKSADDEWANSMPPWLSCHTQCHLPSAVRPSRGFTIRFSPPQLA